MPNLFGHAHTQILKKCICLPRPMPTPSYAYTLLFTAAYLLAKLYAKPANLSHVTLST